MAPRMKQELAPRRKHGLAPRRKQGLAHEVDTHKATEKLCSLASNKFQGIPWPPFMAIVVYAFIPAASLPRKYNRPCLYYPRSFPSSNRLSYCMSGFKTVKIIEYVLPAKNNRFRFIGFCKPQIFHNLHFNTVLVHPLLDWGRS